MGEVYQAFDTRLNRSVAIKVLRADHTIAPELRARFEREARAIAAFNHPNIVSVYDFGVEVDRQYIVSELVEGSSLRSLLTGKPVPLRKLLDIAPQVVDGLAAAHAAGFVHRDLKPENIMLTKDGRVKIVDFGLARQDTRSGSDSGSTLSEAHSSGAIAPVVVPARQRRWKEMPTKERRCILSNLYGRTVNSDGDQLDRQNGGDRITAPLALTRYPESRLRQSVVCD